MALQALSLYGAVTYAKSGAASKVTLRSGGDFQQDFQVDPTNRLLLQRVPLPQVPGEYSTEVSGEGCVYLQVRVMGAGGILGGEPLARQEPGRGQKGQGGGEECEGRLWEREEEKKSRGVRRRKSGREGSAMWRSCENGRSGEAGRGEHGLSHVLSTHTHMLTQSCWLSPRQA